MPSQFVSDEPMIGAWLWGQIGGPLAVCSERVTVRRRGISPRNPLAPFGSVVIQTSYSSMRLVAVSHLGEPISARRRTISVVPNAGQSIHAD